MKAILTTHNDTLRSEIQTYPDNFGPTIKLVLSCESVPWTRAQFSGDLPPEPLRVTCGTFERTGRVDVIDGEYVYYYRMTSAS